MYFASLPWKEQRDMVLSCIKIGTDREIAEQIGGFDEILEELDKAPDTDSIKTKFAKTLKELKQKQSEIQTRIDEASKRMVDYDRAELEAEQQKIESEISDLQDRKSLSDSSARKAAVKAQIDELSARARQISSAAYADLNEKRSLIRSVMAGLTVKSDRELEIERTITDMKLQMARYGAAVGSATRDINDANDAGKALNERWKNIKSREFNADAEVCPTCGRPFDSADIEEHRKAFEDTKAKQLAGLKAEADALREKKAAAQEVLAESEKKVEDYGAKAEELEAELAKLRADREENLAASKRELDEIPTVVEPTAEEQEIAGKIKVLQDVGLGYIKLGQPSTTLSGGESQRVKLATELSKRDTGKTVYILDEPTTGLHFEDIRVLMNVLNRLVDKGNTVIVIEHNLDVIKLADHIIDMGPEGGRGGGQVLSTGTPEEVAESKLGYTPAFIQEELK